MIDQIHTLYKEGKSIAEIATRCNIAPSTVYPYLRKAGIHRQFVNYSKIGPQVQVLYLQGLPGPIIAEQLDISVDTVYRSLKAQHCSRRDPSAAHCRSGIDHNYFDVIDTQQKAYILGFVMADGYNSLPKNTIRIGLSPKDRSVLEFIKSELKTSSDIRTYTRKDKKRYSYLCLYSKHISEQMESLGVVRNKTHTLQFPNYISEPLLASFMLGYFDGDGCFSGQIFSITGNRNFLDKYQTHLMKMAALKHKTKMFVRHPDTPNICQMCYSGAKQVSRIFAFLYNTAPFYLTRKYEKIHIYLQQRKRII